MGTEHKLLVVDDEPVVCESCERIFEDQGFDVQTSTNSVHGLELATREDYDAILLDIRMPQLDGLGFLRALRERERNTPVIIITGYASVPNAVEAMRLGAVDFIPKPFTPEEISGAVSRVVVLPRPMEQPAREAVAAIPPVPGETRFAGEAWLRAAPDGTVKVGAFLSGVESRTVEDIRLPHVGEYVYQGLPLAAVVLENGRSKLVPSPVSGEIVEVHQDVRERPERVWDEPCDQGWLARIRPAALEAEAAEACPRTVVLVTTDESRSAGLRADLTRLGCVVRPARTAEEAVAAAGAGILALVDASSLGAAGPDLVARLNDAVPQAKVVVVRGSGRVDEAAYRARRVMYYAVEPLRRAELLDILASAFRPALPRPRSRRAGVLPVDIRAIRTVDREGRRIALVAPAGALREDEGLGCEILDTLGEYGRPVHVVLGARPVTADVIEAEAKDHDAVVVLQPTDMGRLAGSLLRQLGSAVLPSTSSAPSCVVTLKIQTGSDPSGPLALEPATTRALADWIIGEMTSA